MPVPSPGCAAPGRWPRRGRREPSSKLQPAKRSGGVTVGKSRPSPWREDSIMRSPAPRPVPVLTLLILGLASLLVTGRVWAAEAKRPNLDGSWILNAELTAQVMKDQQEGQRGESSQGAGRGHHRQG